MSPFASYPAVRPCLATLVLTLLVSACGGEDALEAVSGQGNSFPQAKNPIEDFSESSTGDSSNAVGLEPNQVRVTLEVPTSIAPNGELTRRNLRIVAPDRLSVYETDNSLQMLGSVGATQFPTDDGRVIIEFDDGQPLGPDVIIEASYGNTVMRAFAADSDRDIKVNPFSEYLVRNALGGYSPSAFNQVMSCVNSDNADNLCLNKYVWSTLSDQIQDFEIDIPGNLGLTGALQLLDDRADFRGYVGNMADFALLDTASSGKISAQSADYNSVFLGIELGQSYTGSTTGEAGQWGSRVAREEFLQDDNGSAYIYPALTLTSFDVFNIRVTSLANDVPYLRATVAQTSTNAFYDRQSDYWDLNTHATSPGAATVEDELRLLAGRSLYQSVTGRGSSQIIGWTRNPYHLDAYLGGGSADPDRVLQGYFSAGKAIELRSRGRELKRVRTLEDHYVSLLELDLKRSDSFDLGQLSGQAFNIVTFATRLGVEGEPVRIEAGVGEWSVSGQTISQTLADILTVSRDGSGVVTTGTLDRSGGRLVSHRPATISTGTRNIGRLNLDISEVTPTGGRPEVGVGAATPDATLLAFNLDNGRNGDGLLIAAPHASAPTSGSYRVQGLAMGMEASTNRLKHFADATLTITGATTAQLETAGLEVVHTVSNQQVSRPTALTSTTRNLALTDLGSGQVQLAATDGSALVLKGFVTPDQEQLFLRLYDTEGTEQLLGVLMATRLP